VLTLANGERVPMAPTMKLILEVEHLANASPATVSRAGIVYIPRSVLGWAPRAAAWLAARRPGEAGAVGGVLNRVVAPALDWIR
jgi:dynein heavy chain